VSTVEDMASAVKLAYWDLNKAAYLTARNAHRTAQNLGMKYQNWKHKGAGEGAASTPATTSAPSGSGGKNWGSEESTTYYNTQTTFYVHTKREK
jgi:hypothetical protein